MRRPRVIACYRFTRLRKLPALPAGFSIGLIMPEQIQRLVNSEGTLLSLFASPAIGPYLCACLLLSALLCFAGSAPLHAQQDQGERGESPSPSEAAPAGIREVIPNKYQKRYQKWKQEFLASEIGRRQWQAYAHHPRLRLTITITADEPPGRDSNLIEAKGAKTGQFDWDETGNLIAATITLGCQLDEGQPNPAFYPVSYSLAMLAEADAIRKPLLAAAKLAHEFGHLNHAAGPSGRLFRWQNQLIQAYSAIWLTNGHDTEDSRLVRLARELGQTPVEIDKEREYQGEANALLYVQERITRDDLRRALARGIKKAIEKFAKWDLEPYVQDAQRQWAWLPEERKKSPRGAGESSPQNHSGGA